MVTGFTVSAAGNTATITAANVTVEAGGTVDVPITIETTGLAAAIFTVTADNVLTVNSAKVGTDFTEVYTDAYDNTYTFAVTAAGNGNVTGTVTVVTLNVTAPAEANEAIAITVSDATASDIYETDVVVSTVDGSVAISAPKCEHTSLTYTSNNDGTHNVSCNDCADYTVENETCDTAGENGACSKCGYTAPVVCEHDWVVVSATPAEGTGTSASDQVTTKTGSVELTCSKCGETVIKDVQYYGRTKAMNANALYESAISLEFNARKDRMEEKGTYTQAFMRFEHILPDASEKITYQSYDEGYDTTKTAQNRACRTWAYAVKAMQLTEEITTNVFVEIDGVWYSGESLSFSVRSYADQILPSVTTEEKTLVVNMLRYGARMQTFKGYNTENLADANLAAEFASLITETAPTIEGTYSTNTEIGNDCLQILSGYSLFMDSRTEVRLRVRSDRYTAEPAKNDFVIEANWTSAKGTQMTEKYYNEAIVGKGDNTYTQDSQSSNAGRWEFYFAGCPAYDFRQVITFKIYDPEDQIDVSNQFSASFEQLISAGITKGTFVGNELAMYQAMMNYSDAARAYFCK